MNTTTAPGAPADTGLGRLRDLGARACALALPVFILVEVNYPLLGPLAELAVFALLGLALCFLAPLRGGGRRPVALDLLLAAGAVLVFGYVLAQSVPLFSSWWSDGQSLGSRAGAETGLDLLVGGIGLLLVLEASRRTVGWALPILSLVFIAYASFGDRLPDWLLPHRGYDLGRIVAQTFLHSQGVFGVALRVMFSYVFLFVVFGALLEATGATRFIIDAGRRLFGGATGGPAKIAVFSSGLMGSLSGSAVANTATTGTFTIPMMRSAGFPRHEAAGIEAAASSGGALVPPVMGAGAYMMLEIVSPPVTYFEIIRAALIPAILYYLSIFLIVHFRARRQVGSAEEPLAGERRELARFEGVVFVGALGSLIGFLAAGFSVFRAVTAALVVVLALSSLHRRTRLSLRRLLDALAGASVGGVPLVAAAACVGIVIGIVTLTGVGSRLPAILLPLAQESLGLALVMIMASSIILGMGLPSAVCYLLLATLIGPALGRLGVVPLSAHFFIFYFGMMSMVTPPVALAAYAASSIAGSPFLKSSVAAFRFAIVGFTLPYMFVFRPQLLMLGAEATPGGVALAVAIAVLGIVPLAAALAGYLLRPLPTWARGLLLLAALLALYPGRSPSLVWDVSWLNLAGIAVFLAILTGQWSAWRRRPDAAVT